MNLAHKTSGEVNIFGLDNVKNEKEVKERIGFVYDENYYYEESTINSNDDNYILNDNCHHCFLF